LEAAWRSEAANRAAHHIEKSSLQAVPVLSNSARHVIDRRVEASFIELNDSL
jgi:hypothetical protein